MRIKIIKQTGKVVLFLFLVSLLALIRAFETELFYDPFLSYFKGNYSNSPLPEYNGFHLFINLLFRYVLNTMVSLTIIYVLFTETDFIKFAVFLYVVAFIMLLIVFYFYLEILDVKNKLFLFYIRRFMIQPLFILLFVPAFYYQKRFSK